jgi:hypothetical protein
MKGKHIAIPVLSLIPIWAVIGFFKDMDNIGILVFITWVLSVLITGFFVISLLLFFIKEGWDEKLSDITIEDYIEFLGII